MDMLAQALSVEQLKSQVQGAVIVPGDADYDAARMAWNLSVNQYPDVVVVAESAADVAAAVRFAAENDLGIAVQSTGHGITLPADGALLIVTSHLTDLRVDPQAQTAWIGAGLKWGMVLAETRQYALAPLLGSSPDVGVVGYTLGGGMGWLARKHGLATDSVRAFEVVTAAGEVIRANASENADLFWALRGGGGSFGVVTGMEIRLYPVDTVYGGNLFYPGAMAREVFTRYRQWIAAASDDLTSSISVMKFPPLPDVPEPMRGQAFVIVRGLYAGPVAEGEALVNAWREWSAPLMDDFRAMPFSEVGTVSNDPVDPMPGLSSGAWLREITDEVIETLIARIVEGQSPVVAAEVRHAGGAIARADTSASAYSHRDAQHLLQMVAFTPAPEVYAAAQQYMTQVKEEIQSALTGGVYMNFLEGEEAHARTQQGYAPETYRRLMAVKAQYDPRNRFSFSYNIPPQAQ
jgi:FAD/FMN-containing dehydrogenase